MRSSNVLPLRQRVWFQRTVTWGALLLLWEWFAYLVGPFFFPSLTETAKGFVYLVREGLLVSVAQSFEQMLLGFGIAALVGIPLGLLMGSFRWIDWLVGPYINALFVTSLAALIPFIILIFGTDFEFRVAVVFLFAIFYIVINPANGVRSIDRGVLEMGRSFSVPAWKRFVAITLPGTAPFIIAGLRLGLGQAVQGMIIAEIWVTLGTGRALVSLGLDRKLGEFFALAAVIVVIGTALTQLLLVAQRRLTPWSVDVQNSLKGT